MQGYNKPRVLFRLGFVETIPSLRLGFLRGVFLANHLASPDNLTRTTKKQNTYQRKLAIHKPDITGHRPTTLVHLFRHNKMTRNKNL